MDHEEKKKALPFPQSISTDLTVKARLFRWLRRYRKKKRGEITSLPTGHLAYRSEECSLQQYLHILRSRQLLSALELKRIKLSLSGLREIIPHLDPYFIRKVLRETRKETETLDAIRDKEKAIWEKAVEKQVRVIPGFDFKAVYQDFLVSPESDPHHTVAFLRPEYQRPLPDYVPPSLCMAEIYFFILLRMFRYQHGNSEQAPSQAEELIFTPEQLAQQLPTRKTWKHVLARWFPFFIRDWRGLGR